MIRNNRGMTLVEIMIVLAIIGGLMAVLGGNIIGKFKSSNVKTAKLTLQTVINALDTYYADCGTYPTSEQGLKALTEQPGGGCKNWGPDPYLKKIPLDPWGTELIYEASGSSYVLKSLGADKKEGGTGSDADISSQDL